MREKTTTQIWRRICLLPYNRIQDTITELRQRIRDREDVVECSADPYRPGILQLAATDVQPLKVECGIATETMRLVPGPLIYAHGLSRLNRNTSIGKKIRRVRKYHFKLAGQIRNDFSAISSEEDEVFFR